MKISYWIPLAALSLVLVAACQEGAPRTQNRSTQIGSNNYGYQPQTTPGTATDFVTDATPTPTPSPDATDTVPSTTAQSSSSPSNMAGTTTNTPAASPDQGTLPVATPVQGMPGYVTSPYSPYAGYVDVRGYPPNTKVKDPYSGKIFLVP